VATIKSLTGGDTVTARFLHKEFFEFQPAFKSPGSLPTTNPGERLRQRFLAADPRRPLYHGDPKSERDPRVKKTLRGSPQSRSALLAWAVKGCLAAEGGPGHQPKVLQATEAYRTECDTVEQFIAARCVLRPGLRTAFEDLYKSYQECCENQR